MTKSERACKDWADVCELAHRRTVRECRKLHIRVDCTSSMLCGDRLNHVSDDADDHYTNEALEIYERHRDHIAEVTGL